MIKEITKFVETKTSLTIDTDLYAGFLPLEAPDECTVCLESSPGKVIWDIQERVDKEIQIITRALTYHTARNIAKEIYEALFQDHAYGSAGWDLPVVELGVEYEAMFIEPLGDPYWIGMDEEKRHEFSANYIFRIRKK